MMTSDQRVEFFVLGVMFILGGMALSLNVWDKIAFHEGVGLMLVGVGIRRITQAAWE